MNNFSCICTKSSFANRIEWIKCEIKNKELRKNLLPDIMSGDPAWEMLVELYLARLESRKVATKELGIVAAVPPTTGLRWIAHLQKTDLIVRESGEDKRRSHFALTELGLFKIESYLSKVSSI